MSPSILSVSHRINEDIWFPAFNDLLVKIANTREGRDILCIDQNFPEITRVFKDSIHCDTESESLHEFRIGSRYGRLIRNRWNEFQEIAKSLYNLEQNGRPAVFVNANNMLVAAHATDTFYPDANPETTTVDGYITKSDSNWNTCHDAATGDSVSDSASFIRTTNYNDSGTYRIEKIATLFADISTISGTINSATIGLYVTAVDNDDNDGADYVSVVDATIASNTSLATADFDQFGNTDDPAKHSNDIDLGDMTTSAYNTWTLDASGLSILTTAQAGDGVANFGWRGGHDQQDDVIGSGGGDFGNRMTASSSEVADLSQDPKLTVVSTNPFTPKTIIF